MLPTTPSTKAPERTRNKGNETPRLVRVKITQEGPNDACYEDGSLEITFECEVFVSTEQPPTVSRRQKLVVIVSFATTTILAVGLWYMGLPSQDVLPLLKALWEFFN